jgi:hypothetical protein
VARSAQWGQARQGDEAREGARARWSHGDQPRAERIGGRLNNEVPHYFVAEPRPEPSPEGTQLRLAHEVGHCCNLLDRNDDTLMSGSPTGRTRKLTHWQKAVFRSSRYVTYRVPL